VDAATAVNLEPRVDADRRGRRRDGLLPDADADEESVLLSPA
jgi:hypothetical protein